MRLSLIALIISGGILCSCRGETPTVVTSPVTEITASSAVGGGKVISEGTGKVVERGICWSTDPSPSILADRTIEGGDIGDFSSNIHNLSGSTQYYVRAYASNDAGTSYGNEESFETEPSGYQHGDRIIADHTVVDQYSKIPQQYIDEVKKMLVNIVGISHSIGYQQGADLLELLNSKYQAVTYYNTNPPAYSDQYLRLGSHAKVAEDGFYVSQDAIDTYIDYINFLHNSGKTIAVTALGWCYTMTWVNPPGGGKDPVYNVRWAGSSVGGPQGSLRWGLDSGDQVLTGNSVCMDTYLQAVEKYNNYFVGINRPTKVVFTTGPVDGNSGTENGFQRELKHDYIRKYVLADNSRILFDYADILCYNDRGEKNVVYWNDNGTQRPHAQIHPDNLKDYDASWRIIDMEDGSTHIGEVGALRLAKAMWWMLARIAGWDGN